MQEELKFAVLIDADNISNKYIKIIFDEIANYGIATYKRIYGDWTDIRLSSWKPVLLDNSIVPIQQYSYTTGKNSTDSAMIIDAMDILYSGNVQGFCIVSSDSDFTRLVARLRESGMNVIGMGESKTPKPFIAACNQFKYLDILFANANKTEKKTVVSSQIKERERDKEKERTKTSARQELKMAEVPEEERPAEPKTNLDMIKQAIRSLVEEGSDEDGWMFSADLGNQLAKRFPDFDVRNFGFTKLTPFIESMKSFDVKRTRSSGNRNVQLVYVRNRIME
ncbi:NYN domain-containing protein [Hominifimenecus sp. rT4P-3]|uniref:NYN domain-containing protein n=1 Tax=Hominifimenecus sp. rT4P-3 TaxID=3242979 RepID=UPI003DA2A299